MVPSTTITKNSILPARNSNTLNYRLPPAGGGGVTIDSDYKGNRHKQTIPANTNNSSQRPVVRNTNNNSREPNANKGRRVLLSMALKQQTYASKLPTQVAPSIVQTEPVYFNVSIDRKYPLNLYWEERQNSDFRRWIKHRRMVDFGSKKAVDNSLPPVHLEKLSQNARIQMTKVKAVNKYLAAENQKMKERVERAKGKYNAKKWASEYDTHLQRAQQISRLPRPPSIMPNSVFQKIARPQTRSVFNHSTENIPEEPASGRGPTKPNMTKQNTHPPPWNQVAKTTPRNPQKKNPKSGKEPENTFSSKRKQQTLVNAEPTKTSPMKDPREELGAGDEAETEFDKLNLNSQPTSPALPQRSGAATQQKMETPVSDVYNYMKPFSTVDPSTSAKNQQRRKSTFTDADDKPGHTGMKVHFPGEENSTPSPEGNGGGDEDNDDVPLPRQSYRRTPIPPDVPNSDVDKESETVVSPVVPDQENTAPKSSSSPSDDAQNGKPSTEIVESPPPKVEKQESDERGDGLPEDDEKGAKELSQVAEPPAAKDEEEKKVKEKTEDDDDTFFAASK